MRHTAFGSSLWQFNADTHIRMWDADCEMARDTGRSITGSAYVMRGSAPHTRSLSWAIDALIAAGSIASGAANHLRFHKADLKLLRAPHAQTRNDFEVSALRRAHAVTFAEGIGGGCFPPDDVREHMLREGGVDPRQAMTAREFAQG